MRLQLRHSIAALALAALWIVLPALSALHLILEDHVYCAEHGALEEHDQVHRGDVVAEQPGDQLHGRDAVPLGESHEICAHAELATRDDILSPTLDRSIASASIADPNLAESGADPCSVSVLLLAPKTSPPTAA